jgi:beta-lactam-binding protein with PASTA domain
MIPEYNIIFQNKKAGTSIKKIKELTVSVSEGPSPYKEVIVPDMTTWDSDRVLSFINKNYLSNISLEFVNSDKEKNTVIEQDKKGNLKRNDEIKLTFSYGEEEINEVNLSNLCGKSKFEALFYLKQNKINYEIKEDFSNSVKRGYVMSQDIKPGKLIKVSDDKVVLTISKGKKIKVPNLVNMSVTEITNWIIKNRLKLEFTDKYDDKIKDNKVISANYKKGDIIEQGSTINIVISKGKLVMPKFSSIVDFYEWADKYSIKYEEKHEYSDTVAIGEVIKYSVSTGKTIKNDEVITVVISDGKECSVPNIIGLSKSDAISKLKRANLGYNFVYQNSNKVLKDKVISQSISAGSKVSSGTTITVIISNGKKEVTSNNSSSKNNNSSSNGNNSSNNNSNNNNSGGSNNTCVSKTYTVSGSIRNIFNNSSGYSDTSSSLYSFFGSNYPGVKIYVEGVSDTGMSPGSYVGGIGPGSTITSCNGATYTIRIAK